MINVLQRKKEAVLPHIYTMILEGNTRHEIKAAAPDLFPGVDAKKVIDHALEAFASGRTFSFRLLNGRIVGKRGFEKIGLSGGQF